MFAIPLPLLHHLCRNSGDCGTGGTGDHILLRVHLLSVRADHVIINHARKAAEAAIKEQ
jgi:hypothetical protein